MDGTTRISYQAPPDFKGDQEAFLNIAETEDEDVFLMRVPKGFDISILHGTEFSSTEISEIMVEDKTSQMTSVYELGAFSGQGFDVAPLVKSKGKSSLGSPVKGFLCMNKSYKTFETLPTASRQNTTGPKVTPKGPVPMPEGLRVRFTPFGADVTSPSTPDMIQSKKRRKMEDIHQLSEYSAGTSKHERRKMRNVPRESYKYSVPDTSGCEYLHVGSEQRQELSSLNSSRHVKHRGDGDASFPAVESDSILAASVETSRHKKKKRKKHDSSLQEQSNTASFNEETGEKQKLCKKSDSLFSFEDNVFIDRTGNSNSLVSEDNEIMVNGICDASHSLTKSKRKLSSGYISANTSLSQSEVSFDSKKKKKKKKHKREID